jgi:hypothetical protein
MENVDTTRCQYYHPQKRCFFPFKDSHTLCQNCKHKNFIPRSERNAYISQGYRFIRVGEHFEAEHRVIMEQILGRKLRKGELVHHKDGNRSNNNPNNLELWLVSHPKGMKVSQLVCPHCGKPYF